MSKNCLRAGYSGGCVVLPVLWEKAAAHGSAKAA